MYGNLLQSGPTVKRGSSEHRHKTFAEHGNFKNSKMRFNKSLNLVECYVNEKHNGDLCAYRIVPL